MTSIASVADELRLRHARARESVRHWCARAATGSSVIRVFGEGTKDDLLAALLSIPIEQMPQLGNRADFEIWFEKQLDCVAAAISRRNAKNQRVQPGLKWGHAAKVLALYLRDILPHSRFFADHEVERMAPWLFVPVDSKVMSRLKVLGIRLPFTKIKDVATRADFYFVQNLLADNCEAGVPRVVFDDVWADRSPVAERTLS